MIVVCEWQYLY